MKSIHKIVSIALLSILVLGCDKKLDIEPQQSIDAKQAYATPENVEGALIGAYATLYTGALYGTNLNLISELLGSEGNIEWYGTFNTYKDIYGKKQVANNGEASRTWIQAYKLINITNHVLEAANVVKEENRNKLTGEAHFLRGLMYFELVRLYAMPWEAGAANNEPEMGVPLVLKATQAVDEQLNVKRNTVAEVYQQAISDLTKAKSLLPPSNNVRANTFTASAFLARVYLQQSDYANALAEANRVIKDSPYQLQDSPLKVFAANNNPEAIFEVQQNDQHNAGRVNDGIATFYADNGTGRGDIDVSPLRKKYSSADLRRTEMIYNGKKFGGRNTNKWTDPIRNIVIMRMAEMYLIRAEANARLGSDVGVTPLEDLSAIRTRAGLTTTTATVDDILQERVLELAFEGHRIHDIKRTKGKTGDFNYNAPQLVLPIPQRERDVNPNLKQNPGY